MAPIGLSAVGGLKQIGGFWWPESDEECYPVVPQQVADLDQVIPLCPQRTIVVQAGGNVGIWPKRLARQFRLVVTFEPDPLNFRCLCLNVPELNVVKLQAAVGRNPGFVALDRFPQNVGAHQINPTLEDDGAPQAPCLTIDSLNLPSCDLIYLDIEGYETAAILGAYETIAMHKPVIAFESKGLGSRYGYSESSTGECLKELGYREALRLHRDIVMVPG